MRKRLDRALDLLEELLEEDPRYTLHVRGRMPWEYPYEWKKPFQREAYLEIFDRIGRSPALRDAVVFEPFGADMASWMRKIGYILSPSSDESFHLAPAEGMASGPSRCSGKGPGVDEIFSNRWTRRVHFPGPGLCLRPQRLARGVCRRILGRRRICRAVRYAVHGRALAGGNFQHVRATARHGQSLAVA